MVDIGSQSPFKEQPLATLIMSRSPSIDKKAAKRGEIIVITHNGVEAVLLIYHETDGEPGWYVESHLSTEIAEALEISGPLHYVRGRGYVEESFDGIASFSEECPKTKWDNIYKAAKNRLTEKCPLRGECPKHFCPFGDCPDD